MTTPTPADLRALVAKLRAHTMGQCKGTQDGTISAAADTLDKVPALLDRLEALDKIITTYDAYRRRGVQPAPSEYADVVAAIDAARAGK